ncbi:MAG: type II toxin-antitoxin system Phd/YefM family antitoxin [Acidimicrobiales bacterium]
MERIGVRELRQNASRVVSEVEARGPVVVTVNGRDAVLMSPLTGQHRWTPAGEALCYWEELGPDPAWAAEVEKQREVDLVVDPWAQQ